MIRLVTKQKPARQKTLVAAILNSFQIECPRGIATLTCTCTFEWMFNYVEALYGGLVRRTNRERPTCHALSTITTSCASTLLLSLSLFLSISLVLKSFQSDYLLDFLGMTNKNVFLQTTFVVLVQVQLL